MYALPLAAPESVLSKAAETVPGLVESARVVNTEENGRNLLPEVSVAVSSTSKR